MSIYRYTKSPARITGLRRAKKGPSQSHDKLFKSLFEEKDSVIVSSTPKSFAAIHPEDFTENFYISDIELEAYAQGFLDVCTEANIDSILLDQKVEDESLDNIALDDSDIKLSLYRSFKSIYDKWIANSGSSTKNTSKRGYFFNNYGKDDDRTLLEHFKFVDRAGNDVGVKAVIDTNMLSELTSGGGKGPTESLYGLTSRILSKNNFDFWPTPANIPLTTANLSNEKLSEMFKSLDFIDEIKSGPIFNCVYIGGSSRILNDLNNKSNNCGTQDSQYSNDSFDLTDSTDWPEDFKNGDDKGLAIFKVRYGQETQNHFQTLTIDQQEFKETQESLEIIDRLASPKKGNSPSQVGKGNSMYDVYLTRAYNCTVSGLGNMSIQPLMYFKLENVPMFRGTYLINSVKHKISSQKVETEFTGLRQPRVTIPTVTDPISLLDLALSEEAIEGERGNLASIAASTSTWAADGEVIDLNLSTPDTNPILGDNSTQKCPADPDIEDGGIGDAYVKGKRYKIRLCKVKDTQGNKGLVNVEVALNLANMMRKAKADGVDLTIGSNFRTMAKQTEIAHDNGCYKTGKFVYSTCDVATATPGRSNHQSGTAIDFGCGGRTICYSNSSAWCAKNGEKSRPKQYPCFKWMVENAETYGYYNFPKEAWHWSRTGG
jgi:hypothetical protein